MSETPTTFVSYSWDSDDHKIWVRELSSRLRADGINVTLDQWHAIPGDQLPDFMSSAVQDNDYVLIVCTPDYKQKSQKKIGGVKYEGDVINSELFITGNQRKFIPILRQGEWNDAAPIWLSGKYYIDLRGDPYSEVNYNDLITTLRNERPKAPPVGKKPLLSGTPSVQTAPRKEPTDVWEDIHIKGIIVEEVTSPKGDGTRGSALYTVPFRLSRRPPSEWAELFVKNWDRPPRYTSMHRPGIARVIGDKVILDGTQIEEVEKYHVDTLKLALEQTNKQVAQMKQAAKERHDREKKKEEQLKENVRDVANRLKFDNPEERKREERLHHLKVHRKPLWDALRQYEDYLAEYPDSSRSDETRHQKIIRDARVTCAAINDKGDADCQRCLDIQADDAGFDDCSRTCEKTLAYIGKHRLTPHLVVGTEGSRESAEAQRWGWYGDRNKNALYDAVERLEQLITELED